MTLKGIMMCSQFDPIPLVCISSHMKTPQHRHLFISSLLKCLVLCWPTSCGVGSTGVFNISQPHRHKFDVKKPGNYNKMVLEVIERSRFLVPLMPVPRGWKEAELGLLTITSYPVSLYNIAREQLPTSHCRWPCCKSVQVAICWDSFAQYFVLILEQLGISPILKS